MGSKKEITAIIPAYNEEKRVSKVVNLLKKSQLINKIIIIDDGSTDNTYKEIKKIRGVKCIKNKKNKGKGKAIVTALNKIDSDIIFLCDSDLKNFNGKMADKIITPVLKNKTNLCIGIRNTGPYKLIKKLKLKNGLFFLSGQRAFKKELWDNIPDYYKRGYRIEVGMNLISLKKFNGFQTITLNYNQHIKEKKIGIMRGQKQRAKMNSNIIQALLRFYFYDQFKIKKY